MLLYLPYSIARTKIQSIFGELEAHPGYTFSCCTGISCVLPKKTVMDSNLYVESNEIISASAAAEPTRPWLGNVRK